MTPPSYHKKVLKAPPLPVRPAFRREFLDFERGIRMGGLEPHERITQIVKARLVEKHGRDLVIDKWGRGRYWQWICWIVRENRDSKPASGGLSFRLGQVLHQPGARRPDAGGGHPDRAGPRAGRPPQARRNLRRARLGFLQAG